MANHETISRKDDTVQGSDRSFGLVFTVVFALVGGWQLWHDRSWGWWLVGAAGAFLLFALLLPRALAPLNRLWFRFGMLLHHIINPVVMGLMFFGTILPIGWLMRLFGKRPLNLDFDSQAASYWVKRDPPGPEPESFKQQF